MARVKFSGLISEISGSVGGATFSRSSFGCVLKTKHFSRNYQRGFQRNTARAYSQCQYVWKILTDSERAQYISFARAHKFKSRNAPDKYLSGYQLFIKYHSIYNTVFDGFLINFPTTYIQPPYVNVSIAANISDLNITNTCYPSTTTYNVFQYFSPPTPRPIASYVNRTRLLIARPATNVTADRLSLYTESLHRKPVPGDYIYVKQYVLCTTIPIVKELPVQMVQVTSI